LAPCELELSPELVGPPYVAELVDKPERIEHVCDRADRHASVATFDRTERATCLRARR